MKLMISRLHHFFFIGVMLWVACVIESLKKNPVYFLFYNKNDGRYLSLADVKINQMLFKKRDAVEFFDRYADCMKFLVFNAQSLTENEARKRKEYKDLQRHFDN